MNAEGKRLAEVVKRTHKRLRKRYRLECDEAGVWADHVMRQDELQTYSQAMVTLATHHWHPNSQATSRVNWIHTAITQYYREGGQGRATEKELRKLTHLNLSADYAPPAESTTTAARLKVLDVGSCYNPFFAYKELDVTAIDLCPASESVKKGDFLNITVTDPQAESVNYTSACNLDSSETETHPTHDIKQTSDNTTGKTILTSGRGEHEGRGRVRETGCVGKPTDNIVTLTEMENKSGVRGAVSVGAEKGESNPEGFERICRVTPEEANKVYCHVKENSVVLNNGKELENKEEMGNIESTISRTLEKPPDENISQQTSKYIICNMTQNAKLTKQIDTTDPAENTDSTKLTIPVNITNLATITHLTGSSFDVVIFCLLLEYIPSPRQRLACCQKAYDLLRPSGILCIVTPDSKHQNANVHLYKLWKISLGFVGFSRVKYEKVTHFHGLVMRKGLSKSAWRADADRELNAVRKTKVRGKFATIDYDKVSAEMYIPQDFKEPSDSEEETVS